MKDMNQYLRAAIDPHDVERWLRIGIDAAWGDKHARARLREARDMTAFLRTMYYDTSGVDAPLLTQGEDQHKLGLGALPVVGLTLHHHAFKSRVTGITFNLCSSAGDCTRLCVLNNSNGQYETVKNGWRWKSDLLATFPWAFFIKLGWELERQVRKHGHLLGRLNVNSDLMWVRFAPSLVNGTLFPTVTFYDYTKHEYVLYPSYEGGSDAGWLTPNYRVAFSNNERTGLHNAAALLYGFLGRGGNVAAVTDRYYTCRTKQPIDQWCFGYEVVDGDKSDEWILNRSGVIGDLAVKPRTKALRAWAYSAETDFVLNVYGTAVKVGIKPGRELVTA